MESNKYWNNRYSSGGDSGYGSYGEQSIKKLNWLRGLDIQSIVDVGCGDFHFGKLLTDLYPHASYLGIDTSDVIIEQNRQRYPQFRFTTDQNILRADLILCLDVLFHVLDDLQVQDLLNRLKGSWTKYLALTAYERDEPKDNHVRIRKFDPLLFGTPKIREVVEEDGQLYFYLFEKKPFSLEQTSCCLITKDATYPELILNRLARYPFGEIQILTHCDSPHRKQELFQKAKYDWIYYQDDDCFPSVDKILPHVGEGITCAMKPFHIEKYKDSRIALLGWGAIFPKSTITVLKKYIAMYGQDSVYKRETERIMTYLNYPQVRVPVEVVDLPSAFAPDRLSNQPGHYDYIPLVEKLCSKL